MLDLLGGVVPGALLLLTLALLLKWKKRTPKLTAILMLGAGAGLVGVLNAVFGIFTALAGEVIGIGGLIVTIITLVLVYIVVDDLWPKHAADSKTIWAAFLLPSFAALTGGVVATLIGGVSGGVLEGGNALMGHLF